MTPAWALVLLIIILTAPFWVPIVFVFSAAMTLLVVFLIAAGLDAIDRRRARTRSSTRTRIGGAE